MRELERIDRICELLKEKWKEVPDQRLGQFLINYIFGPYPHHPRYDGYIFFKEDDEIEDLLEMLFLHM